MAEYQSTHTGQEIDNAVDAVGRKYEKPSSGIPATDLAGNIPKSKLAQAVQTSLNKADSALQSHQDISLKANLVNIGGALRLIPENQPLQALQSISQIPDEQGRANNMWWSTDGKLKYRSNGVVYEIGNPQYALYYCEDDIYKWGGSSVGFVKMSSGSGGVLDISAQRFAANVRFMITKEDGDNNFVIGGATTTQAGFMTAAMKSQFDELKAADLIEKLKAVALKIGQFYTVTYNLGDVFSRTENESPKYVCRGQEYLRILLNMSEDAQVGNALRVSRGGVDITSQLVEDGLIGETEQGSGVAFIYFEDPIEEDIVITEV